MTPSGLPAWSRTSSHVFYGGDTDKRNLLSQGVIDPTTDVSATELARLAADMEAIVRTMPFMVITYLNNDSSPAAPTIEVVYIMTGVRTTSYAGDAAPAGFPSAARNGTGDVTFTLDSSYSDPYSVAQAFDIGHLSATARGTVYCVPVPQRLTATTFRVRSFNGGGALADQRVTVEVY